MMLVRLGDPLPVGGPAALLSRCAAAGLRVPAGGVLLDTDGTEPTTASLGPLRPGERVTLRLSRTGTLPPPPVSTDDVAGLAAALAAVWRSGGGVRRDVLVLRAVDAVHAGVADLLEDADHDGVSAVELTRDGLPAGPATDVRQLLVPRLAFPWSRAHRGADPWRTPLPPYAMRLSRLLRAVRRVVGPGDWDVGWADDGRACWLTYVGARPRALAD